VLPQRPELLHFWYRQSTGALTGLMIHDDLLTPGIVSQDDPPFQESSAVRLELDARGNLLRFERMPAQQLPPAGPAAAPPGAADWNPLFAAAGLDPTRLQPAEPLWTAVEASDSRLAWTAAAPRPLRVEAASLRGQPVYFQVIQPWTEPDRTADAQTTAGDAIKYAIYTLVALVCCFGSAALARRNLKQGRGDRAGALRLAIFIFAVQMAVFLTRSHLTMAATTLGMFFIALATSGFYGMLIWTLYLGLEPYVRRRWPHTLISWSSVLIGRLRDPVVGRDTLVGCLLGAVVPVIGLASKAVEHGAGIWTPNLVETRTLLGVRGTLADCLMAVPHGIRSTLLFFFLILILRAVLRRQWLVGAVFVVIWTAANLGGASISLTAAATAAVYAAIAVVMLRWGLLSTAVGVFVMIVLGDAPFTIHSQAWYFESEVFMLGLVAALAAWACRTAIGNRQILKEELLD